MGALAGFTALAVVVGAMADDAGVPSDLSFTGRFMLLIVIPILTALAWRFLFHPRMVLCDDGVVVTNPIRTTHVPWDDLLGCECVKDEQGIVYVTMTRRSGPPVKAFAVSNTGTRFSKPGPEGTNMDRACASIVRRVQEYQSVAAK